MTLPEKVASVTRESRIGWDFIGSSAAGGAAMGPVCARRQLWSWTSWAGICLLALAAWRVAEGVMAGEEPAPGAASAGADQSTGPESRDDYGSPVWALASAMTGGLLGSATIGGELWIKDLSTSGSFRLGYGPMGWARSL